MYMSLGEVLKRRHSTEEDRWMVNISLMIRVLHFFRGSGWFYVPVRWGTPGGGKQERQRLRLVRSRSTEGCVIWCLLVVMRVLCEFCVHGQLKVSEGSNRLLAHTQQREFSVSWLTHLHWLLVWEWKSEESQDLAQQWGTGIPPDLWYELRGFSLIGFLRRCQDVKFSVWIGVLNGNLFFFLMVLIFAKCDIQLLTQTSLELLWVILEKFISSHVQRISGNGRNSGQEIGCL